MGFEIQKVDDRNFLLNGEAKSTSFRAFANGENIAIVSDGSKTPNITNGENFIHFITKDEFGVVLYDGSLGDSIDNLVKSINEIVNFNYEIGDSIPSNLIFANAAARDAYFDSPDPHLDELQTGVEIILEDNGTGDRVIQKWLGETNPASYPLTPDDYWSTLGSDTLTAQQIVTLAESVPDKNFVDDEESAILSKLSLDVNGDVVSTASFIFPPGSVKLGDSVIESGGRTITAKSDTTGNQGALIIQLFDDSSYSPATVYDEDQIATTFDIQTVDDTVASGVTTTSVYQNVQNDVQFMRIRFKPENGIIASEFNFSVKLSPTGASIYEQTIQPTDPNLVNLGSGIWELKLSNPSQLDAGFTAYVTVNGLSLLGGIGYDGSDTVRFGDPLKSDFFPWLQSVSIPIIRNKVALDKNRGEIISTSCVKLDDVKTCTIQSIDVLEGGILSVSVNASNSDKFTVPITVSAKRGSATTQLGTINSISDAVNEFSFTITDANVNTLRPETGSIEIIFTSGSNDLSIGCISVVEENTITSISSNTEIVSLEDYNNLGSTAGYLAHESINGGKIDVSGNTIVSISNSNVNTSTLIEISGDQVVFNATGTASITGYTEPYDGDIIRMISDGTNFELIKIGSVHEDFVKGEILHYNRLWNTPSGLWQSDSYPEGKPASTENGVVVRIRGLWRGVKNIDFKVNGFLAFSLASVSSGKSTHRVSVSWGGVSSITPGQFYNLEMIDQSTSEVLDVFPLYFG